MNEFFQKNWTVLVISALMALLVGVFAVWKFYPGLLTDKEGPSRIDKDLLIQEQASTKKSATTTNDPNCDKSKNSTLSLKNEKEVVDQKNVPCKKEDTQAVIDKQIKPNKDNAINVDDSIFTEGQNNAQSNGDQQAAQDQAADLIGHQQGTAQQQVNQQPIGNQSPTDDQQQVDSPEQSPVFSNQEKPGSDSPNQHNNSNPIVATGDKNPNLVAFGWGFDVGSQTDDSPQKPDKQNQSNKPQNQEKEQEGSSDSTSEQEPSSDESTADSSDRSNSLLGGVTDILKPSPKPTPKPEPKPQSKPQISKPNVEISLHRNQSTPQKNEDQLEVHISALQSQKQDASQIHIRQQNPLDKQTKQPEKPKKQPAPKLPIKFPGAEKFSKNAKGPEIEALIILLNKSGYQTKEKHRFTSEVSKAVQKFQQDQGWKDKEANGIPGPETWKKLISNYKGGFPGEQYFTKKTQNDGYFVKKLEKKLKEKGLISKVTQSGKYTETMKKAVQNFQKSQGWKGKDADGIPNQETWKRLMK